MPVACMYVAMQDDDLFEQCDALGIMVLPGICCCDAWQSWDVWTDATHKLAAESLRSQVKRLRRFPSMTTFLYSSDQLPPPEVEQSYIDVFQTERWQTGLISTASYLNSTLTGVSGVKMAGPYGWVPPNYWYTDTDEERVGTAFGFATEISPGAAPLTLDSMEKTVPADQLWDPKSEYGGPTEDWNYHCGAAVGAFGSLTHFQPGMTHRYGNATSAAEYLAKAQLEAYESHRAMFEAYSRNKYNSTGLIQWMLQSAWPSNMWHLYDYYYQIGGSGFGAKKACSPEVHLLYSYPSQADNDHESSNGHVWAVNSRYTPSAAGLVATATEYDLNGKVMQTKKTSLDEPLAPDGVKRLMALDLYSDLQPARTTTILVRLRLSSGSGEVIEDNWYWLPPKLDKFEMGGCFTGCKVDNFANMRDLPSMPASPKLSVSLGDPTPSDEDSSLVTHTVQLKAEAKDGSGDTKWLAFFVRLRALDADGNDVLPATWSDNFVSLQAGESVVLVLGHEADATVAKVVATAFNSPATAHSEAGGRY